MSILNDELNRIHREMAKIGVKYFGEEEKRADRLISADEVLRHIEHWEKGRDNALKVGTSSFADGVIDGYARVKSLIEMLPSYEAVKHGRWIKHWDDIWPEESTLECSLCHEEQGIGMLDTNYCPYCGAKMDEKRSEDA